MKKKILGVVFLSTVILSQHVAAQDDIPTPVVSDEARVSASSEVQSPSIDSETPNGSSAPKNELQEQNDATEPSSQKPQRILRATVQVTTQAMYRLYNPNSGEHFYTANAGEAKNLILAGWYYEGVGWFAPEKSSTPVYRLYNPNAGDHHFTTLAAEKDMLTKVGWRYEGIGWYSDDAQTVKLLRAYNPNAQAGSHNYTTNGLEQALLIKAGWRDEGTAWFGSNIEPLDNQDVQLGQTYRPNTWYTVDGQKKHTDQNKNWQTGFQWISGQIYYFDSNGNMQANKTVTDRGNTYQLKTDGTLTSGNATIEKAISSGMTKVGNSPYVLGGGRTSESIAANQFDCSSFT